MFEVAVTRRYSYLHDNASSTLNKVSANSKLKLNKFMKISLSTKIDSERNWVSLKLAFSAVVSSSGVL